MLKYLYEKKQKNEGFGKGEKANKKTVALREVQAVNVHNIPHYIHVISECAPSDAVSNLCDRFR